jgi:hypothetical protein
MELVRWRGGGGGARETMAYSSWRRGELKRESKDLVLSSFLANKPTSQKPFMIRGTVFLLDG